MNDQSSEQPQSQPAKDAGFATAVSILVHDMHNALAIIQQSAGLLGDLAGTAGAEPVISGDDALEIATLLNKHAKRADRLGTALARILRTPIPPGEGCEVNRALADAQEMLVDGVAGRGAKAELKLDPQPLEIKASTQELLHVVLATALLVLEARTSDCVLEIRVDSAAGHLVLAATGAGCPNSPFLPPERLAPLIEQLGGTLAAGPGEGRSAILTLPQASPR